MTYFDAIREAMAMLADDECAVFVGQCVKYPGNALFKTMQTEAGTPLVPMHRRIELPVIEDFQLGYCTGLALHGFVPVSIFPRWDFLLLAANQLVNHLDKIPLQTEFRPKVIIRTAVGARYPLDSGLQHTQDHTAAFRLMLRTVEVLEVNSRFDAMRVYRHALEAPHSCLVVERQDLYNE